VFYFSMKKHTNVRSPVTENGAERPPDRVQSLANAPRWVAYYRVSTAKQGASGLGLEAQTDAVTHFVGGRGGEIVASFTETESGKKASNRPELIAALALCRKRRATLVIAKLDRLARNVHFISGLLESNVPFVAADQPTKDRFMLHLQAAFAEEEGRRISLRTREALAAAKRRGVDIGATGRWLAKRHKAEALRRAQTLRPLFKRLGREGIRSPAQLVEALNSRGVPSPSGTGKWHRPTVHRVLRRIRASRNNWSWRAVRSAGRPSFPHIEASVRQD
jgi:DNA invertase Pin-like site-specific DNA recombinase